MYNDLLYVIVDYYRSGGQGGSVYSTGHGRPFPRTVAVWSVIITML